jgi:hypothetical protein
MGGKRASYRFPRGNDSGESTFNAGDGHLGDRFGILATRITGHDGVS